MAGTNDFKAFATDANANVTSQEEWETLTALKKGFSSGKASSAQVSKALRQPSTMAAVLGQFIANAELDALDDGDVDGLVAKLATAITTNLGLGEAAKMSAAALVINGNTLTAKIPVVINGVNREFIIQASQISSSASNGVITFPSAFPNACIAIFAHDFATASTDLSNVRFYMPGRTSASWTGQNMSTGSESSPATWCWLAIGW